MNSVNKNEERDIKQAEDILFDEWSLRRHPFATDGCADPKMYSEATKKIVFALKERNWGHSKQDQIELQLSGRAEKEECRYFFNGWWTMMAQWADVLLSDHIYESWHKIQSSFIPSSTIEDRDKWVQERNKESLGKCACIQLKKAPGGGGINKEDFFTVVKEDKDFVLRQLSIYSPHFIISCGSNDNWAAFTNILFEKPTINRTNNGINYFLVQLNDSDHKTAVINFGHPSMRVNATLWGALAFGLREALAEVFPQLHRA